jgi:hypothetical protein
MKIHVQWIHDHIQEFRVSSHPALGDKHPRLMVEVIRGKVWFPDEGERDPVAMAEMIGFAIEVNRTNATLCKALAELI